MPCPLLKSQKGKAAEQHVTPATFVANLLIFITYSYAVDLLQPPQLVRFYAHSLLSKVTSYYYYLLPGQRNLGYWEESDADAASPNSCPGSK